MKNLIIPLMVLIPLTGSLVNAEETVWPRAQGMGGCSVSLSDGGGGFTNPAFLAELRGTELLFGYGKRFGSEETSWLRGGLVRAFPFGGLGLGYEKKIDREDALMLSYGRFLPYYLASLGVSGKLLSIDSPEGMERYLCLGAGFLFRFLELSIGYAYQNLIVQQLGGPEDGTRPTAVRAYGISYRKPDWVYWSIQTSSIVRIRQDLRIGAEVWLSRALGVRIGADRWRPTVGIGLEGKRWLLDISALNDSERGNTYSASLKLRMGRRFLFE